MMKFNKISQDYKKLNTFIRSEMKDQKISQASLAYALNLTQGSVSQKLAGNVEWTLWEILNIFSIMNVSFEYKSCTGATERKSDD